MCKTARFPCPYPPTRCHPHAPRSWSAAPLSHYHHPFAAQTPLPPGHPLLRHVAAGVPVFPLSVAVGTHLPLHPHRRASPPPSPPRFPSTPHAGGPLLRHVGAGVAGRRGRLAGGPGARHQRGLPRDGGGGVHCAGRHRDEGAGGLRGHMGGLRRAASGSSGPQLVLAWHGRGPLHWVAAAGTWASGQGSWAGEGRAPPWWPVARARAGGDGGTGAGLMRGRRGEGSHARGGSGVRASRVVGGGPGKGWRHGSGSAGLAVGWVAAMRAWVVVGNGGGRTLVDKSGSRSGLGVCQGVSVRPAGYNLPSALHE